MRISTSPTSYPISQGWRRQPEPALPFRPIPGEVPFARFLEAANQTTDAAETGRAVAPVADLHATEQPKADPHVLLNNLGWPRLGDVAPPSPAAEASVAPRGGRIDVYRYYAPTGRTLDVIV